MSSQSQEQHTSPLYAAYKANAPLFDACLVISAHLASRTMGDDFLKVFSIREWAKSQPQKG